VSIRSDLADLLADGLPGYRVIGYPGALDGVTRRTVALWADRITAMPEAPNGHYAVTYTVRVITPYTDPAQADDDLDEAMGDVLALLWDSSAYLLSEARREVVEDTSLHCWTLTVTGGITITGTPALEA